LIKNWHTHRLLLISNPKTLAICFINEWAMGQGAKEFWNSYTTWRTVYYKDLLSRDIHLLNESALAEREFIEEEYKFTAGLASKYDRILDVGCGTGRCILPLAKTYPSKMFFGVDYSNEQIEYLRNRILSDGISNVIAICENIEVSDIDGYCPGLMLCCNQTIGTLSANALDRIFSYLSSCNNLCHMYIGGFSNLNLLDGCYSNWGIEILSVSNSLVKLKSYESVWHSLNDITELAQQYSLICLESREVKLGYLALFGHPNE
jgi:SAM-dependent methyltransferase